MTVTNKEWLYACEQLLYKYKANRHIVSVRYCALCELTRQIAYREGRRDGCAACLWKKYMGRTCGEYAMRVVPNYTYAMTFINAMETGYWCRFRILHLEGWIWRLKKEIADGKD